MPEIANLWTVREVAKRLRLSERTVYKLLRSQELPSPQPGGLKIPSSLPTRMDVAATLTARHRSPSPNERAEIGGEALSSALSMRLPGARWLLHARRGLDAQEIEAVGEDPANQATQA